MNRGVALTIYEDIFILWDREGGFSHTDLGRFISKLYKIEYEEMDTSENEFFLNFHIMPFVSIKDVIKEISVCNIVDNCSAIIILSDRKWKSFYWEDNKSLSDIKRIVVIKGNIENDKFECASEFSYNNKKYKMVFSFKSEISEIVVDDNKLTIHDILKLSPDEIWDPYADIL